MRISAGFKFRKLGKAGCQTEVRKLVLDVPSVLPMAHHPLQLNVATSYPQLSGWMVLMMLWGGLAAWRAAARRKLANNSSFPKALIFHFFLFPGASQPLRRRCCPHKGALPIPSVTARTLPAPLGSPKCPGPGCASRTGTVARPHCEAPPRAHRTPTPRATPSKPSVWVLWIKGCPFSRLTKRRVQMRVKMGKQ